MLRKIIYFGIIGASILGLFLKDQTSFKSGPMSMPKNTYPTLTNLETMRQIIEEAGPKSLVIYDIDDTLIVQSEKILRYCFKQSDFGKRMDQKLRKHFMTEDRYNTAYSQMWQKTKHYLMDPGLVPLIREMQDKGIPIIACSYMLVHQFGVIPTMKEWRYHTLLRLHIDFCKNWQDVALGEKNAPEQPLFYKGILMTDKLPKGEVITRFLTHTNLKPDVIVCFDDRADWLEDVEGACKKHGIKFRGYHYYHPSHNGDISSKKSLIENQVNYFINHHEWVNEEESAYLTPSSR